MPKKWKHRSGKTWVCNRSSEIGLILGPGRAGARIWAMIAIMEAIGSRQTGAEGIRMGVDWVAPADPFDEALAPTLDLIRSTNRIPLVDEIGYDPDKVNAQVAQGLHESFERRADWQCQQLELQIDQDRATLEEGIVEIEGPRGNIGRRKPCRSKGNCCPHRASPSS